jgi:hypothetical protein
MHYVMPAAESSENTAHKADRLAVADTFDDRWSDFAAMKRALAQHGRVQITDSQELCILSLA